MVRVVALITGALVFKSYASVEDTCNADLGECDDVDVSLAQLRLRTTAKTDATHASESRANLPFSDTSYSMDGECIAAQATTCGNGPRCPSDSTCNGEMCICNSGCAGVNSQCYQSGNQKILAKFTLENPKKSRKLFVKMFSTNNQIMTTPSMLAWSKVGATDFDLYALPGSIGNQKRYLLVSNMYPDYAITTWPSDQGAYQPFRFIARKMQDAKSLAELAVVICDLSSQGKEGQWAIGGTIDGKRIAGNTPTIAWANMNAPSEYLYGNDQDTLSHMDGFAAWKASAWGGSFPQPGEIPACPSKRR